MNIQNSRTRFLVIGIGEILWDILPDGKQLGGAPANFAYHAQNLGAEGYVVSCVGDDELGTGILMCLEKLGMDPRYISIDKNHPSGTVSVDLDNEGKPHFFIHENVAWDFIPLNSELLKLAAKANAVCFGSLCQRSDVSRNTIRKFLEDTKADCHRVMDINLRQSFYTKDIISYSLKQANILKLNDEELSIVAEMLSITGSETEILSHLTDQYSLDLIALTKGRFGSLLYARGTESIHPGFPVKVADTVGAGDSFTAALVMGKLLGQGLDEINEQANRLASSVCSQKGA